MKSQMLIVKNRILLLLSLVLSFSATAQVLRNEGSINVSAGYLVLSGSFQQESSGGITLDGIITVSGNWTNNGSGKVIISPDTNGEVIFNGSSQTIGGSANEFDFEKLTINSGSTTEVTAGKGVTSYGACTFTSPLVLKTTAIDFRPIMATFINNSTVSGSISSEYRYTSRGSSIDKLAGRSYYLSPSISDASSALFNPEVTANDGGNPFSHYIFSPTRGWARIANSTTTLFPMHAYGLRSATTQTITLNGTPNTNSSYSVNLPCPSTAVNWYYMLGNPYQSVIDWDLITLSLIDQTIYYRTSTTSGVMVTDTYQQGGVGTNNNGTATVDGKIPPMQAYWVRVTGTSGETATLTTPSSARVHSWGNSSFLKSKSQKNDREIFSLFIYSKDIRDQLIIVQSDSAKDGYDKWDSYKRFEDDTSRALLYTYSPENYSLVIQSVKPISGEKQFPIALYNTVKTREYRFEADLSKITSKYNYFLEDKKLNITQDLFQNPSLSFISDTLKDGLGTRFILHILKSPNIMVSNPSAVCEPQTVDLTLPYITDGSENGLTYTYWIDSKASIPYNSPSNAESGVYYIKGTAKNGSYSISEPILVTINTQPTLVVHSPNEVCSPSSVDLTSSSITLGSSPDLEFSYWTDINASIPYATPTSAISGSYFIKGTAVSGCYTVSEAIEVKVNPTPTVITTNPTPVVYPATADLTKPEITLGSTYGLSYSYWLDESATTPYLSPQYATTGNYYIQGINDLTACYAIAGPVVVTVLTGIPTDTEDKVLIYSYEKEIHIDNCKPNSVITIYDIIGKQHYNGVSMSNKEIIPFNSSSGLYIVKIVNGKNAKSQKIYIR